MRHLTLGVATAVVGATLLIAPLTARFATTEYVSGNTASVENDPGGWVFARDLDNAVPYSFGFGAASIGGGSLYVPPIAGPAARKFIGELFLVTPMADIETISYDFKIGAGGDLSDRGRFYFNVYANFGISSPTKFYDCRYQFNPASGSTTEFTTVTFDPLQNYSVTPRTGPEATPLACPASPAAMGPGATLRAFVINMGDTNAGDTGLDGYFDNVVVATTAGETVYDFEPVPQSKADCAGGGWQDYGTQFRNQGQCVKFIAAGKR